MPPALADGRPDVRGFWRAEKAGTYALTNPDFVGLAQVRDRELKRQGKPTTWARTIRPV